MVEGWEKFVCYFFDRGYRVVVMGFFLKFFFKEVVIVFRGRVVILNFYFFFFLEVFMVKGLKGEFLSLEIRGKI